VSRSDGCPSCRSQLPPPIDDRPEGVVCEIEGRVAYVPV
jgi:hypothetical protein